MSLFASLLPPPSSHCLVVCSQKQVKVLLVASTFYGYYCSYLFILFLIIFKISHFIPKTITITAQHTKSSPPLPSPPPLPPPPPPPLQVFSYPALKARRKVRVASADAPQSAIAKVAYSAFKNNHGRSAAAAAH